jgi:hypothetical protein
MEDIGTGIIRRRLAGLSCLSRNTAGAFLQAGTAEEKDGPNERTMGNRYAGAAPSYPCVKARSLSQPRATRALSAVCFHCARLSAMIFVDFVAAWLMCAYSAISRWTRWPSFCR